jgi:hypothetical protein
MGIKIEIPIQNYTVEIGHQMQNYISGPPINGRIVCKGETTAPKKIDGKIEIYFYSAGTMLPQNTTKTTGNAPNISKVEGTINAMGDIYTWFLDAIRNEECWAIFYTDHPESNEIRFSSRSSWGHTDA